MRVCFGTTGQLHKMSQLGGKDNKEPKVGPPSLGIACSGRKPFMILVRQNTLKLSTQLYKSVNS